MKYLLILLFPVFCMGQGHTYSSSSVIVGKVNAFGENVLEEPVSGTSLISISGDSVYISFFLDDIKGYKVYNITSTESGDLCYILDNDDENSLVLTLSGTAIYLSYFYKNRYNNKTFIFENCKLIKQ